MKMNWLAPTSVAQALVRNHERRRAHSASEPQRLMMQAAERSPRYTSPQDIGESITFFFRENT